MKIAKKTITILCDDIRMETGNKFSIMGVYPRDVLFKSLPAILPKLSLVIMLEDITKLFTKFEMTLKCPEMDPAIFTYDAPKDIELGGQSTLLMSVSPFKVKIPGKATFEITFPEEKKPSIVHEFEIKTIEN